MSLHTTEEIASGGRTSVEVNNHDDCYYYWFATEPVTQAFCDSVTHLELTVNSLVEGSLAGREVWFELVIMDGKEACSPRTRDGVDLVWKTHQPPCGNYPVQSGVVFDCEHPIFTYLKAEDVIAVRISLGERPTNIAFTLSSGTLVAKRMSRGFFVPAGWTPKTLVHAIHSNGSCHVAAHDQNIQSKLWFSTPPLPEKVVSSLNLATFQLYTRSQNQGWADRPELGTYTWFEIALRKSSASLNATHDPPRVMSWRSHDTSIDQNASEEQGGEIFNYKHELLQHIEPGDVIEVWVYARFACWTHDAYEGRLELGLPAEMR
ncbi:hypothetical protein NLI96_g6208 [Meripilus lineatus]|uniref:Uncharacterized protein n=1 Tax=Meripilus lineatus TaxID=2056292 RepID=A0AAD5V345_9APHY|nr:hypothetical protein NLI96_g6208 [Physisporinus lineatus]